MNKMIFLNENIFILRRIRRDETGMTLLFLILLIVLKKLIFIELWQSIDFDISVLPVGTVDSIADIVVDIVPTVEHYSSHPQNYKFAKLLVAACLNIE